MTTQNNKAFPKDQQPVLRVKTLPNDANADGSIFGGWLMSQLDIAGWIATTEYSGGYVATVAVKNIQFLQPLFVYDLVSFYAEVAHVGKTSITVDIEVYAQRFRDSNKIVKVSEATLVYVALSKPGVKREISIPLDLK